jgi:hypothetical protein
MGTSTAPHELFDDLVRPLQQRLRDGEAEGEAEATIRSVPTSYSSVTGYIATR